jgi:hypothetical protein
MSGYNDTQFTWYLNTFDTPSEQICLYYSHFLMSVINTRGRNKHKKISNADGYKKGA